MVAEMQFEFRNRSSILNECQITEDNLKQVVFIVLWPRRSPPP